MYRKRKKKNFYIKILNIIFLFILLFLGLIFFIISLENEKDIFVNSQSLLEQTKESTLISKEDIIDINEEPKEIEAEEKTHKKELNPDFEYAVKLFEVNINEKINKIFNKPFNYEKGSNCEVSFDLNKNEYKVINCNTDNIFKRELELAINSIMPIKKITYNNINLKDEKLSIIINIED